LIRHIILRWTEQRLSNCEILLGQICPTVIPQFNTVGTKLSQFLYAAIQRNKPKLQKRPLFIHENMLQRLKWCLNQFL